MYNFSILSGGIVSIIGGRDEITINKKIGTAAMEIYLDANATTPVLPVARDAAIAAMSLDFGNPSSTHSRGLQAKSLKENVRAAARRVLGASSGQLLFVSGATEGIQTAVLSALTSLRIAREKNGASPIRWLLY